MRRYVLPLACVLTCAGFLPVASYGAGTAGSAAATPPPEIYHVVTSALCARLHEQVRPAVAMILENDGTIAKSPPLFNRYARGTLTADVANPSGSGQPMVGDSIYSQTPETSMALQQMSYLVTPIARNIIAAQTLLDDPKLLAPTGNPVDDATLSNIKRQLLHTIAYQSASLDIINGFVATLQMGELQHAGEEYLAANGPDITTKPIQVEPNQYQDPNTPGLPPNPYAFDVTTVPGLAVGYNQLSKIVEGLGWLQQETHNQEQVAGKTLSDVVGQCGK